MQGVKQDQAAIVADGDAQNWVGALPQAVDAHNKRPHSAVFGAPENVEKIPEQDFRVLQNNARKSLLNRSSQLNKSKALKEAGAFRAPIPSKRSFEPRYGDVQLLGPKKNEDGNDVVRNRGEGTFVLKQIQPVVQGSAKSAGRLTDQNLPRKNRLQERAAEVEEHVRGRGGSMEVSTLERQIRRGLLGLLKVFRRNNITIKGFLKLYKERFTMRNGIVTVKNAVDTPTPTPTPPDPDPVPGSIAFEKLPLSRQIEITDARSAARREARRAEGAERLKSVRPLFRRS